MIRDIEGFLHAGDPEYAEYSGYIYKLDNNGVIIKFAISLKDFHV